MSATEPIRFYIGTQDAARYPREFRGIWPECSKCRHPLRGEVVQDGALIFHEGCYTPPKEAKA